MVNTESGQLLAMKELSVGAGDRRALQRAANELRVLEGVLHPHLVRYYGCELHRVSDVQSGALQRAASVSCCVYVLPAGGDAAVHGAVRGGLAGGAGGDGGRAGRAHRAALHQAAAQRRARAALPGHRAQRHQE